MKYEYLCGHVSDFFTMPENVIAVVQLDHCVQGLTEFNQIIECGKPVLAMRRIIAETQPVPEGFKVVPVEPTTEQYGGLARDVIQWMRFTESKNQHSESLVKWLKDMGNEIPSWLMSENEINHLSKHVLSKGTIAAIIYKAMLAAAPVQAKDGE